MKKNIFFLANIFPEDESIGITKKVISQIESLNKLGYNVKYYTGYTKKGVAIYNCEGKIIFEKKYKTDINFINRILRNQLLKKTAYQFFKRNNVDVDLCYMRFLYFDHNFLKLIRTLKKQGKTTVIEAHAYPIHVKRISIYTIIDIIDIIYTPITKKYIDLVVAISNHKHIWGKPTINIDNAIDIDKISIKKNNNNNKEIRFICVANEYTYHGYDRLLIGLSNYYAEGKNKKIVKIDFVGQYLKSTYELVKKLKLDRYVVFYGKKYGKDLDVIYDNADIAIGALAHHRIGAYFGSSLKTKEYFAKGIPFIYGWTEPAFDETYKYAHKIKMNEEPININEILEFYKSIENDELLSANMRKFAEENYTWEKQMKKMIDYIEEKK